MCKPVFAKLKGLSHEMDLGLGCHAWIDLCIGKGHNQILSFKEALPTLKIYKSHAVNTEVC
jgi:hypothetical protein